MFGKQFSKLNADKFLDKLVVEYNNSQILQENEIAPNKSFWNVKMLYNDRENGSTKHLQYRFDHGLIVLV